MTEHQSTPTLTPTPTPADAAAWLGTVDDITALIAAVGPYPVVLDRHQRRWTIVEIAGDHGDKELRARPLATPNQLIPPTGTPAAAALLASCGPLLPTTALSDPTVAAVLHSDIDHVDERTSDLLWGRLPAREWVEALASGWVDSLVPDHPAARWQWYAQILDSPHWGMVTIATGHRELCLEVAKLCRTMSALPSGAAHSDSDDEYAQLQQHWQAVDAAVMSAIGDHDPTPTDRATNAPACDRGVFEALDTIIEITTDALEWLRGRPAVGLEVSVAAFDALLHAHSPAVGRALLIALLAHTLTDYPAHFSLVDVRGTVPVPAGAHAIHERAAS
ncbi:hypothetical protein BH92_27740 (plasmid) [Rhodococcoides fascians A21d2]|uniref:hypothetical protein n=1 Tax=Rhodococcoides fascians TaxID=1828 RepID=UPI0005679C50|nr:hypothetical protein [Rhodococcus fascians]QII03851.1 hypothetical protein BH92_27740 [Rhodococcus fascians A21d2]